ncbi:MAG TPA: flagellar motor protein [Gammaproteobacteria bacterium]|nr:flagellar motor protein [Gammaproteobacteria bacterium]
MRLSSIVAVLGAFGVIVYTNHSEGDPLGALVNLEAAVIVLGGSTMAILNQFHLSGMLRGIKGLKWLIRPPTYDQESFVEQLSDWTRMARREGLLSLETVLAEVEDPFLADGLQMVIDGLEVENLRSLLATRMETDEREDTEPAEVWEAVGGYAPTLGVLGAVMGLIHVMLHLSGAGASIGSGIAAAFVATLYGVGSANLIFIPMGKRLGRVVEERVRYREMVVAGLALLAEGANPQTLKMRLNGYISRHAPKKRPAQQEAAEEVADAQA